MLERLYKNVISAKLTPLEKILEYYQMRWARYWHDNIKFVKKDFTKDDYKALGEKCIEDYYTNYYPFNQSKTIHVEKRVSFALDNEGRYKIVGFIDRLAIAPDGTYEIHYYKTSGNLPTQKAKDEEKLTFPDSNDEKRSELEKVIRESSKWNEVSSLNLT